MSALVELLPYRQASAGYVKAEVLLLMGGLAEWADWCQRIEAIAVAKGHSDGLLRLWHVQAQLRHHVGDHAGACALYAQIEQLTTRMGSLSRARCPGPDMP